MPLVERIHWPDERLVIVGSRTRGWRMIALFLARRRRPVADNETRFRCPSCDRPARRHVVLPRSEVNRASGSPFNRAVLIVARRAGGAHDRGAEEHVGARCALRVHAEPRPDSRILQRSPRDTSSSRPPGRSAYASDARARRPETDPSGAGDTGRRCDRGGARTQSSLNS